MHLRWIAVVAGLAVAAPVAARAAGGQGGDFAPAVVVQVKSLDAWLAVAKDALKEFAAAAPAGTDLPDPEKQLAEALGPDWRKAIDPARPLAAAAALNADNLPESPILLLVPTNDPEAFLALLKRAGIAPEKDGDLYRFTPPGTPLPVFLRFANRYAYLSLRDDKPLAKGRLPAPDAVLLAGEEAELTARVFIERVPRELRELAAGALDQVSGAIPADAGFAAATQRAQIEAVVSFLKAMLNDGRELSVKLRFDRAAGELNLDLGLVAKPGSPLAGRFRNVQAPSSRVAAGVLGRDTAAGFVQTVPQIGGAPSFDAAAATEELRKALAEQGVEVDEQRLRPLVKAVLDAVQVEVADQAVALRGPFADGKYALVFGMHIRDGQALEAALKQHVPGLGEKARDLVKFDAAKAGGVNVHQVTVPGDVPREVKQLFGDGPVWVAIRDDAVFACYGGDGAALLREALAGRPRPGPHFLLEAHGARTADLIAKFDPNAAREVKKLLTGKLAGRVELVRVTSKGGDELTVTTTVNLTALLRLLPRAGAQAKPTGPP